ncbi:putative germin-like protein 9-2 [Coffea arabica]|uniref:Germin-like protein n=1 Tax=Coffea arabica TaxID=13443 RepID=A0A6P6SBY6_COFAR|nr:putative germin-like protein 9-2 [Coffea arabica]
MALRPSTNLFLTLMLNLLAIFPPMAMASDADILTDFNLPPNVSNVDATFFTYTAARSLVGAQPPTALNFLFADKTSFPALDGQGVSLAVLRMPGGAVNPPHSHPRATELLLLISGYLEVGFIDSTNKLFNQTLNAGDMYVFPKGLVHYQFNYAPDVPAISVSAFGSANPGLVSIPSNLFQTDIEDRILAWSFKTDIPTIQRIKASVQGSPQA